MIDGGASEQITKLAISEEMERERGLTEYAGELGFKDQEEFLNAISPNDKAVVIDLGSGAGNFSKGIKEKRPNWTIFSFDLEPMGGQNPVAIDFSALPIGNGTVDAVVGSNSAGMYASSQEAILQGITEMHRVLKPGGKALINIFAPFEKLYLGQDISSLYAEREENPLAMERLEEFQFDLYSPDRLQLFNAPLIKSLKEAGFELVNIRSSLRQSNESVYALELIKKETGQST